MSNDKDVLFQGLSDAVVDLDEVRAKKLSEDVVSQHIDAYEAIDRGLAHGMNRAGLLFEEEEYFVPELLIASDAMYAGLEILKPHIKVDQSSVPGKVVLGVIEGDTHDIGKNLVKIILEAKGFEVYDLGRDIAPRVFVEKAKEVGADIIGLSTLMTTTMAGMASVIEQVEEAGFHDRTKIIVGGAPVSKSFADKIGADGYSSNAIDAGELAINILASLRSTKKVAVG